MSRAGMSAEPTVPTRASVTCAGPIDGPWLAYLFALGLPFLLNLGGAPLFDVDEGAFAEASREMLASGDLGHTTLNGTDRFDKPVAVYWLQAAFMAWMGPNEWAARLPSALCAWVMCVCVARFAREQWGAEVGLWAGALLATSAGMLMIGRASTADALLNLCLALTAMDLWRHLQSGQRVPLRRAAVWAGLGLLTKGPVAVVLPGAALTLWLFSSRSLPKARAALSDPLAWGLLLATSMPWYLYAWARHGEAFIQGFLMRHNVDRFGAAMEGHAGNVLYFVVLLPLLWLPWSGLLLPVIRRAAAQWSDEASRFFLLWAAFVLVFFSASGTKLPHYGLYASVPLALLMARQAVQHGPILRAMMWLGLGAWAALLMFLPWSVQLWSHRISDPLYRSLLAGLPLPAGVGVAAAALFAVLLLFVLASVQSFTLRVLACGGGVSLVYAGLVFPWGGEALQGPIQRAALVSRQHEGQAVQWGVHWPSVAFYRQQETPRRPPRPGELAFVRLDRSPPTGDYELLYRERGIGLVRRLGRLP